MIRGVMKATTLGIALTAMSLPAHAQRAVQAPWLTPAQLRELDAHIEQVRAQWEVPGRSVTLRRTQFCCDRCDHVGVGSVVEWATQVFAQAR